MKKVCEEILRNEENLTRFRKSLAFYAKDS
jgi:hypothetical protein